MLSDWIRRLTQQPGHEEIGGFIGLERVLQSGLGQCPHCAVGVVNVLIEIREYTLRGGWDFCSQRAWFAAHPERGGFRMHACRRAGHRDRKRTERGLRQ